MGIRAGRVVEADQPRCISTAIGTPGSGSHAENRGAGPVQGLDVQIRDRSRKWPSTGGLIREEAGLQRGDGVLEAPALVQLDLRKVFKVTGYPE